MRALSYLKRVLTVALTTLGLVNYSFAQATSQAAHTFLASPTGSTGFFTPRLFDTTDFTAAYGSQAANKVMATPNGSAGLFSPRALVGADIPAIDLAVSGAGGVTGDLAVSHLAGGVGATSLTFFRGDGTWSAPVSPPRIVLSANLSLYVSSAGSGGSDSNNCTAGTPCLTPQHAYDVASYNYDSAGRSITIYDNSGATYTTGLNLHGGAVGGGTIIYDGLGTGGAGFRVTFSVTNGNAIYNTGVYGQYQVQNIIVKTITSGFCIINQVPGYLFIGGAVKLLECATGGAITSAATGSVTQIGTAVEWAGDAPNALLASSGGHIYGTDAASVGYITSSPTFTNFANATALGLIQMLNWTFSGTVTAKRYSCTHNGAIYQANASATYWPGTTAGSCNTGGDYS